MLHFNADTDGGQTPLIARCVAPNVLTKVYYYWEARHCTRDDEVHSNFRWLCNLLTHFVIGRVNVVHFAVFLDVVALKKECSMSKHRTLHYAACVGAFSSVDSIFLSINLPIVKAVYRLHRTKTCHIISHIEAMLFDGGLLMGCMYSMLLSLSGMCVYEHNGMQTEHILYIQFIASKCHKQNPTPFRLMSINFRLYICFSQLRLSHTTYYT